jgi:hypothetical protein
MLSLAALIGGLLLGGTFFSWFSQADSQSRQSDKTDPAALNHSIEAQALPWVGSEGIFRERGAVHYRASGSVVVLNGHAALLGDGSNIAQDLSAGPGFRIDMRVRSTSTTQQGPAVLLLLGTSHANCNLLIGQSRDRLEIRCLTSQTNPDGTRPHLSIAGVFIDDQWQTLRFERRNQLNCIILNGEIIGELLVPGDLSTWSHQTNLCIGSIPRGGFGWQGEISDLRVARLTDNPTEGNTKP